MNASSIFDSVFSLFFMILVGLYGSKRKIITEELNKGLTDVLIHIALPFMIVISFIFTYDETIKINIIKTFYYSLITYLLTAVLSYILLIPVKKHKKTILHFANVFTNTGYVGFPILNSIYGPEGIIYGSIFNMFFVIFVWTYGLNLFKGDFKKENLLSEAKKIFLNPSIIAVIIGLIILIAGFKVPNALLIGMKNIGNMTGPLSMIIIGVILSNVKFKNHLSDWHLYYGVFAKLTFIPLLLYFLFIIFVVPSKALTTVIVMSAMPASAMTSIFADGYNKEKDFAAVLVSVTTLLSLVSVPILLNIIN